MIRVIEHCLQIHLCLVITFYLLFEHFCVGQYQLEVVPDVVTQHLIEHIKIITLFL